MTFTACYFCVFAVFLMTGQINQHFPFSFLSLSESRRAFWAQLQVCLFHFIGDVLRVQCTLAYRRLFDKYCFSSFFATVWDKRSLSFLGFIISRLVRANYFSNSSSSTCRNIFHINIGTITVVQHLICTLYLHGYCIVTALLAYNARVDPPISFICR